MPSYVCKHSTCQVYLKQRGYCTQHEAEGKALEAPRIAEQQAQKKAIDVYYDQHRRNKSAKQFYNSSAWQYARKLRLTDSPVCEYCKIAFAQHVHHVKPLAECDSFERLDQANLMSVCAPCHNQIEAIKSKEA